MRLLTDGGVLVCGHRGVVQLAHRQSTVFIAGRPVLVSGDPEGRPISGCPNAGPTVKPCTTTLSVRAGESSFVTIDGLAVCLDTLVGTTDGTPPGGVSYTVQRAGQSLVEET